MTQPTRTKRPQERITAQFALPGKSGEWKSAGEKGEMPRMHVLAYGPDGVFEQDVADPVAILECIAHWPVTWVNVDPLEYQLANSSALDRFAQIFNLHELELEDLINMHQRAKVEEYGDHLFVVTRMLVEENTTDTEQLSLILAKNFVITFREVPADCLDPVRDKIRRGRGRIRNENTDYLMYALIDAVVDSYFPLLSKLADRLDEIEDDVLARFTQDTPERLYGIRRDLISIRRAVWPTREALSTLYRDTVPLISATTRVYLRDCYDHSVRIIDLVETYREVAAALMEVHYNRVSTRLNEVMKVLTIITTVFIPPTFIAGLYGMNFHPERSPLNMPELNWYFGYPFAIVLMIVFDAAMLSFLYWKGWLGNGKQEK